MSVCYSASLVIDDERLCYAGPQGAHWQVPLAAVRLIAEFRSADLDFPHYLAVIYDTSGAWLQCPATALGVEGVLATLSSRLHAALELKLQQSDDILASRVLWPQHLAGQPLFELRQAHRTLRRLRFA